MAFEEAMDIQVEEAGETWYPEMTLTRGI